MCACWIFFLRRCGCRGGTPPIYRSNWKLPRNPQTKGVLGKLTHFGITLPYSLSSKISGAAAAAASMNPLPVHLIEKAGISREDKFKLLRLQSDSAQRVGTTLMDRLSANTKGKNIKLPEHSLKVYPQQRYPDGKYKNLWLSLTVFALLKEFPLGRNRTADNPVY